MDEVGADAGPGTENRINKYIKVGTSLPSGNVTLMQQEEVDRKAIKAKRGPGVHSSFTVLLRAAVYIVILSLFRSLSLSLLHKHTHTLILSTSRSSFVPSELFLGAELSRLKETVHLNVHNLLSKAHSWSHCSPVAPQRSSPGETDTEREGEKRFYPVRIQWAETLTGKSWAE